MPVGKDIKSAEKDFKRDIRIAKKIRLSWRGILGVFILSLLIGGLFDYWGRFELALPVLGWVGVIGLVIAVKREMWTYKWFWVATAIIAAIHVALLLFVPWTTKRIPGPAVAGAMTVDLCLILAILAVIKTLIERRTSTEL